MRRRLVSAPSRQSRAVARAELLRPQSSGSNGAYPTLPSRRTSGGGAGRTLPLFISNPAVLAKTERLCRCEPAAARFSARNRNRISAMKSSMTAFLRIKDVPAGPVSTATPPGAGCRAGAQAQRASQRARMSGRSSAISRPRARAPRTSPAGRSRSTAVPVGGHLPTVTRPLPRYLSSPHIKLLPPRSSGALVLSEDPQPAMSAAPTTMALQDSRRPIGIQTVLQRAFRLQPRPLSGARHHRRRTQSRRTTARAADSRDMSHNANLCRDPEVDGVFGAKPVDCGTDPETCERSSSGRRRW